MSKVWSCNEWDQLEEVIVGNPLNARFPTPDRSTQVAEFPDRSLAEIPRGPFPQQVIEETEEDLNEFARILEGLGVVVRRPQTWPHDAGFSTIHWEFSGILQLLPPRYSAGHRRPNHRNAERHPQPRAGDIQLSHIADGLHEVRRKVVQRPQTHAVGFALRGRRPRQAHAPQR